MNMLSTDSYLDLGLKERSAALVGPLSATIALLYLVLSFLHPVFVPRPGAWIMLAVSLVSSSAAAAIWLHGRARGFLPEHANLIVGVLSVIAFVNCFAHLAVDPKALHTSNLVILFVVMGLVFLSRAWFYPLLAAAGICWLLLASFRPLVDLDQWGWVVLFTGFASSLLMEQRRRAALLVLRREHDLQQHARLLQDLVKAPELASADQAGMFRRITESAAPVLGVDRVGIWLFEDAKSQLVLRDLYDSSSAGHSEGALLSRSDFPDYFLALERDRFVAAAYALTDPRTACLGDYLRSERIASMLDAPILIRGEVVGVLCHELRGEPRNWSIEEQTAAASLAEIVALTIESQQRAGLERRVLEAERLERMGVLAGGVAHDFNNLLMVVLGNTELLQLSVDEDSPLQSQLSNIQIAASGAAELARQMLAYSGRGVFIKETLDLSALAKELIDGWEQTQSGRLKIANHLVHCALPVSVDPTQIRQVLLNLLTNAADSGAHRLQINSGFITLDQRAIERCVVSEGIKPGRFCFVEVKDDGAGMTPHVLGHMFDPFFTTKPGGSGLGMAACLGILKAHQGTIRVDSETGRGARVRIFLPAAADKVERMAAPVNPPDSRCSGLQVVVVEDQELVRQLAEAMLTKSGHCVSCFSGMQDLSTALQEDFPQVPDLALVDLTLGDGDGVQVVNALRQRFGQLGIVLMSGYDSTDALTRITDHRQLTFLKKPFTAESLQSAISLVVAQPAQAGSRHRQPAR